MPNPYSHGLPPVMYLQQRRKPGLMGEIGSGISNALGNYQQMRQAKTQNALTDLRLQQAQQAMSEQGKAQGLAMANQQAWQQAVGTGDPQAMMAINPQVGMQYLKHLHELKKEDRIGKAQEMQRASSFLKSSLDRMTHPSQLDALKRVVGKQFPEFPIDQIPDAQAFAGNPESFKRFVAGSKGVLKDIDTVNSMALEQYKSQLRDIESERTFGRRESLQEKKFKQTRALKAVDYIDSQGNIHRLLPDQSVPLGWKKADSRATPGDLLKTLAGDVKQKKPTAAPVVFKTKEEFISAGFNPESWKGPGQYRIR